ncbi:MAG: hypothetical protein OXG13_17210 [Gemmatimonadaceae bacterium]|nr:hypothetical protein [Gemmatimonadaceae bacterium]
MPRIHGSIEQRRRAAGLTSLPLAGRLPCALVLTLLLAKGGPVEGTPESRASVLFLLISPSARVNGMGQAGVALPDEPAGYYNPGAAALSSPARTVQSRLYLSEMPWLPGFADDMTYAYHAVQAAGARPVPAPSWWGPTSLAAALYGSRTKMDLGQLTILDAGNAGEPSDAVDTSNNLGVSLALRSFVQVGVGATSKWVSSDRGGSKGSARAHDVGLMVVAPLTAILERLTGVELALSPSLLPRLEVGYGIAWHNRGPRFAYTPSVTGDDPLPANRRNGWSGRLGMDWRSGSLRLAVVEATLSRETYRPQIEGVQATSLSDDDKRGFEVSILETICFRRGKSDDFDGEVRFETSGETIRSDGFFRYMAHHLESQPPGSSRDALLFLARHLSISWSRFVYHPKWPARGHAYLGLSF